MSAKKRLLIVLGQNAACFLLLTVIAAAGSQSRWPLILEFILFSSLLLGYAALPRFSAGRRKFLAAFVPTALMYPILLNTKLPALGAAFTVTIGPMHFNVFLLFLGLTAAAIIQGAYLALPSAAEKIGAIKLPRGIRFALFAVMMFAVVLSYYFFPASKSLIFWVILALLYFFDESDTVFGKKPAVYFLMVIALQHYLFTFFRPHSLQRWIIVPLLLLFLPLIRGTDTRDEFIHYEARPAGRGLLFAGVVFAALYFFWYLYFRGYYHVVILPGFLEQTGFFAAVLCLLFFPAMTAFSSELLFRGFLLAPLSRAYGNWPAIITTALLHGALHFIGVIVIFPALISPLHTGILGYTGPVLVTAFGVYLGIISVHCRSIKWAVIFKYLADAGIIFVMLLERNYFRL